VRASGPDVYWVGGVDPDRERQVWIAWEEGGRLPDVIVELLSPSTAAKDRGEKKELYARVFGTAEYFLCDPETSKIEGFRLAGRSYWPIPPDAQGRLWSEQLGVFLGVWHGIREGRTAGWPRLFRADGSMILTGEERAEAERLRAEAADRRAEAADRRAEEESRRAEAAEAENARLRALLAERGLD
jgi:hypothetical protein